MSASSGGSGKKKKRKRQARDSDVEIIDGRHDMPFESSASPSKKRRRPDSPFSRRRSQLPTPGPTPVKKKAGRFSGMPIRVGDGAVLDDEAALEDSDDGLFVKSSQPEEDLASEDEDGDSEALETERKEELRRVREQHVQAIVKNPPEHGFCTIFVGPKKTPFQSSYKAAGKSEILSDKMRDSAEMGSFIDLSDFPDVKDTHFVHICEYLQHSDFTPKLMESSHGPPRLEGLVVQEQKDDAAIRCAYVFHAASYLRLDALQALCVNKLKALYPLSPFHILVVATIRRGSQPWGCDAEGEFLEWLVDHISEYYRLLEKEEPRALRDLLGDSQDLRRKIRERLAANPGMGRRGLDDDDE